MLFIKGSGAGPILMGCTTFGVPGIGVDLTGGLINVHNTDKADEKPSPTRVREAKLALVHGDYASHNVLFERGSAEIDSQEQGQIREFVKETLFEQAPDRMR